MAQTSILVLIMLMFVGGGSSSTAGGVKVTTFAVVVYYISAVVRGKNSLRVGYRTVSQDTINKAMALILLSMGVIVLSTLLLLAKEPFPFLNIFFEVVSAFGTVGLSMGITSQLSMLSKAIIIVVMFIGRVGPVAFFGALTEYKSSIEEHAVYAYPYEDIAIG